MSKYKFVGDLTCDANSNIVSAKGKKIFDDGRVYEGDFIFEDDNFTLISGTMNLTCGTIIKGDFILKNNNFLFLTKGTKKMPNNDFYEGEFDITANDNFMVKGKLIQHSTGSVCSGNFTCDKMTNSMFLSSGKIIQKCGTSFEGDFELNNNLHFLTKGKIIDLLQNGTVISEGEFVFVNNRHILTKGKFISMSNNITYEGEFELTPRVILKKGKIKYTNDVVQFVDGKMQIILGKIEEGYFEFVNDQHVLIGSQPAIDLGYIIENTGIQV